MCDTIDRKLVAPSRHSIFIRGFPGAVNVDDVREFFIREAGKCRIDFYSLSIDKKYLFLALRFDVHRIAQNAMTLFDGKDVLGHNIKIKWFKDLRRARAQMAEIFHKEGGGRINNRFPRSEHMLNRANHPSYFRGGHHRGNLYDKGTDVRRRRSSESSEGTFSKDSRSYSQSCDSSSTVTSSVDRKKKRSASLSCSPRRRTRASIDSAAVQAPTSLEEKKKKKQRRYKKRKVAKKHRNKSSSKTSSSTSSRSSSKGRPDTAEHNTASGAAPSKETTQSRESNDDSSAPVVSKSDNTTRECGDSMTEDFSKLNNDSLLLLQNKKKEIELAYKQDCETFATVVKMLINKDARLEEQLQTALRETLNDVGQQCMEELRAFMRAIISSQTKMS